MDAQLGWSAERWASIISLIAAAIACFRKHTPAPDLYAEKNGRSVPIKTKIQNQDLRIEILERKLLAHEDAQRRALEYRKRRPRKGIVESEG
jgi:hypothetical protein